MKKILLSVFALLFLVSASQAGVVLLSWDCGTCAAEGVMGFVLFYGPNDNSSQPAPAIVDNIDDINSMPPSPYDVATTINDPDARTYELTLPKGRWYFRIVAYGEDQFDSTKFEVSDFNAVEVRARVRPFPPKNLR